MITIQLQGDRELVAKLSAMPNTVRVALTRKVTSLAIQLQRLVQDKLNGPVLNVRTGALRRSIQQKVESEATSVTGTVYSAGDVKYAAIHEFGGTTSPHIITVKNATALAFVMGGRTVFAKQVHHPGSRIPARPYMAPSLEEMTPAIIEGLTEAVRETLP